MSGRVGNLSEKQAGKLAKFKETLKDVLQEKHDDYHLLRFLRARQFDLKKAESMFREDIEWRQKMDIDKFVAEYVPPEVIEKYYGGGVIGCDKEGAIVWIDTSGKRDVKGLLYSCTASGMIKHQIHMMERLVGEIVAQNKKLGKDSIGLVAIADMEGFGGQYFWKPWTDLSKKISVIMEKHYPEVLKKTIIVNTPKLFLVFHAILKPFMREETRKKIVILGSDWKTEILKYIDADVLPAHYGGKRVDPDGNPKCPSVVKIPEPVPKSYYLEGFDISNKNMTTRDVPRAGTLEFKYEVKKPGSLLNYEFRTKDADIGFSVKRIGSDGKKIEVIGKERYNCHISPEEGQTTLDEPGTYVVKFDNSYSLTRSKTLSYFVELLEPLDPEEEPEFQEQENPDVNLE